MAFDCYSGDEFMSMWSPKEIFGNFFRKLDYIEKPTLNLLTVFYDSSFLKAYLFYLKKYSDIHFVNSFFKGIMSDLKKYENLLQIEYKSYSYDTSYIYSRAEKIRNALPEYEMFLDSLDTYRDLTIKETYEDYDSIVKPELLTYFVNAYVKSKNIRPAANQSVSDAGAVDCGVCDYQLHDSAISYRACL